jgi:hypothetical protein
VTSKLEVVKVVTRYLRVSFLDFLGRSDLLNGYSEDIAVEFIKMFGGGGRRSSSDLVFDIKISSYTPKLS